MEEAQLAECLDRNPHLSVVADFSGDVVAALTAHPSQVTNLHTRPEINKVAGTWFCMYAFCGWLMNCTCVGTPKLQVCQKSLSWLSIHRLGSL